MSTAILPSKPDSTSRRRRKEPSPSGAAHRVALNLARLQSPDVGGNERETLILQNRELREQHPAIDELLGGELDRAPDYTSREAAAIVGMLGSDGSPTDAFYDLAREIGYPTPSGYRITRARLDAYRKGER